MAMGKQPGLGTMDTLTLLEKELVFLGLLDKAREIYREMGCKGALPGFKSG